MTKQKQWDIHEAVILLDALLQHQEGAISRAYAIQSVSDQLRAMANNRGQDIDDIYRNINGISFQMASMESALKGSTIMKPASKLFSEVVRIYREEKDRYIALLGEAKEMAEKAQKLNEESFMTWLSERVSPAQLSEYYEIFQEIKEFCSRLGKIRGSLFDNLDESKAKKIEQAILSNKAFQMSHRRQMKKATTVLQLFKLYVKENAGEAIAPKETEARKEERPEPKDTAAPKDKAPPTPAIKAGAEVVIPIEEIVKQLLEAECATNRFGTTSTYLAQKIDGVRESIIREILEVAPWAKQVFGNWMYVKDIPQKEVPRQEEKSKEKPSPGHKQEIYTLDLQSNPLLVYSKPVLLSYFGEETTNLRSWADLLSKIVAHLYDDYSHVLHVGMSFSKKKNGRVELGNEEMAAAMFAPKKFVAADGNTLYVETNTSASNIATKIRFLLNL